MHVRFLLIAGMIISLAPMAAAVDVFVSATAGQPYGVASIEIPVDPPVVGRTLPPITVIENSSRVLYPIENDVRVKLAPVSDRPVPPPGRGRLLGRVGGLIRELTSSDQQDLEQTVTRRVTFLIRGRQPIQVRLVDADGQIGDYEIVPDNDMAAGAQLMSQWWTAYTDAARHQIDSARYPPLVESYLVAMLSGRVGLPLPDWYTGSAKRKRTTNYWTR